jgi:hypothetical protein
LFGSAQLSPAWLDGSAILSQAVGNTKFRYQSTKVNDDSGKKKDFDWHFVRAHNQIRQVNGKSDISQQRSMTTWGKKKI